MRKAGARRETTGEQVTDGISKMRLVQIFCGECGAANLDAALARKPANAANEVPPEELGRPEEKDCSLRAFRTGR